MELFSTISVSLDDDEIQEARLDLTSTFLCLVRAWSNDRQHLMDNFHRWNLAMQKHSLVESLRILR